MEITRRILDLTRAATTLIRYVADRPGHDRRYALDTTRLRALGWGRSARSTRRSRPPSSGIGERRAWWEPIKSGEYRRYDQEQYGALPQGSPRLAAGRTVVEAPIGRPCRVRRSATRARSGAQGPREPFQAVPQHHGGQELGTLLGGGEHGGKARARASGEARALQAGHRVLGAREAPSLGHALQVRRVGVRAPTSRRRRAWPRCCRAANWATQAPARRSAE